MKTPIHTSVDFSRSGLQRGVLEVPEVDRLYGELNKLYELAQQELDDEQRQLRATQTQIVSSLKAWKALVK